MSATVVNPSFGPFTDGSALLGGISGFVDTTGQPLSSYTPKSVPAWVVSDATIASVSPAADGLSANLSALKPGTVTLTVTVDGVVQIGTITIVASGLGGFTITVNLAPPPTPPAA